MSWIKESNRPKHLLYAIPAGVLLTILFVAGLAAGMEFKDKQWGGKWDWLDIAATSIVRKASFPSRILSVIAEVWRWEY